MTGLAINSCFLQHPSITLRKVDFLQQQKVLNSLLNIQVLERFARAKKITNQPCPEKNVSFHH